MSGPFVIKDLSLIQSLPGQSAVVPEVDKSFGVQCVGLVKYYSEAGAAGSWTSGDKVSQRPDLAIGAAIATFNSLGKYANKDHGNHACFFIGFLPSNPDKKKNGFKVLEQHVKPDKLKIQTRNIYYRDTEKGVSPSDNASAYSVILR